MGAHCLSYFFYVADLEVEEVLCTLETVIPDHPAPLGDGGFRVGAAGDAEPAHPQHHRRHGDRALQVRGRRHRPHRDEPGLTGVRFDIGYDLVGTSGTLRYSYDRINDIQLYRERRPGRAARLHPVQMGPTDPRYAALLPVSGLGLGYNDYKAIEAREMIAAVAEGRPAFPTSPSATACSGSSRPAYAPTARGPGVKPSEIA